jgi:hypothetical protein
VAFLERRYQHVEILKSETLVEKSLKIKKGTRISKGTVIGNLDQILLQSRGFSMPRNIDVPTPAQAGFGQENSALFA